MRPNLDLTVESCGLSGRFAAIASLEDIERGKPDPQVFLVAAAKAGVAPGRAVVFEDAPVGIQAAKAAGMHAVGVTTTHPAPALWDAGADEVVAHLGGYDVAALLQRLQPKGNGRTADFPRAEMRPHAGGDRAPVTIPFSSRSAMTTGVCPKCGAKDIRLDEGSMEPA